MMKKILVIEDEPNILELVLYNLNSNGYHGIGAEDGVTGLGLINSENPDLVLLDIMLPGKSGLEICQELRGSGDKRPIIMLTAKSSEAERVMGLECGADDYISKPFGIRELMARIMAVLRRYEESYPFISQESLDEKNTIIKVGSLTMDQERYRVTVENIEVPLTSIEFQLLCLLAKNPGIVFTRNQLLDKVWGIEYAGETRTVDVHIRHLRKKLATPFGERGKSMEDHFIETIRGKGYRFG